MDELPDEIDGADDPDFCVALDEMLDFFKKDGKYDTQLMYWIPTKSHDNDAIKDCLNDDDALDDITTFALRFWGDTDVERVENVFGDLDYCEFFQQSTYVPSEGNSPDSRYFVLTMSDFVCLEAAQLTEAPTDNPTENPTPIPTEDPTVTPTLDPTENPVEDTDEPTVDPTENPTEDPISQTEDPTENPTEMPSVLPSEQPTENPTEDPTENPSEAPTEDPTEEPSSAPSAKGWWSGDRRMNQMNRRQRHVYRHDRNEWNEHAVRNNNHDKRWDSEDRWKTDMDRHWKLHWRSVYEDKCWTRDRHDAYGPYRQNQYDRHDTDRRREYNRIYH